MDESRWTWPDDPEALKALQLELAAGADEAEPWSPDGLRELIVAAVFAAFPRGEGGPGRAGQTVVTAAVLWQDGRVACEHVTEGVSRGPYAAGLLALRCGPLLEAAVRGLPRRPYLLLVDATGRDHPRRAGLALHLGARLGLPSVGVTNRALVAGFDEPGESRGSSSPLLNPLPTRLLAPRLAEEDLAGYAVRTRAGARPVLAHAAWRTTPELARDLVLAYSFRWRTPTPLRAARTLARSARAARTTGGLRARP